MQRRTSFLGTLGLLFTTGCATMRAEVEINAPPQRVWGILTDLPTYAEWNPFFVRARGKLTPGESLELTMQPVGKSQQSFSPTVRELERGRQLVWRGQLGVPWLFDGTHHFIVVPLADNRTKFVQYEDFAGVLVPFAGFDPYRGGWEKMNRALKVRAESPEKAVLPSRHAAP